jgi:hypothetical protein
MLHHGGEGIHVYIRFAVLNLNDGMRLPTAPGGGEYTGPGLGVFSTGDGRCDVGNVMSVTRCDELKNSVRGLYCGPGVISW